MQKVEFSKGDKKGSVEYHFGDTLEEAVKIFGEDVVFSHFRQKAVIALQGVVRPALAAGKSPKELQEVANGWKLGVASRTGKSKVEKARDAFNSMTEEEKAAFISELKKNR